LWVFVTQRVTNPVGNLLRNRSRTNENFPFRLLEAVEFVGLSLPLRVVRWLYPSPVARWATI